MSENNRTSHCKTFRKKIIVIEKFSQKKIQIHQIVSRETNEKNPSSLVKYGTADFLFP